MEGILIPISFFAAVFGILYVYYTTRNKERMSMIENGVDPSIFVNTKKRLTNFTLKFGMLFIGVALGVLCGAFIDEYTSLPEGVGYVSMIFLFGGAALVWNSVLEQKKNG